jgi:hypothetical protein
LGSFGDAYVLAQVLGRSTYEAQSMRHAANIRSAATTRESNEFLRSRSKNSKVTVHFFAD